MRVKETCSDHLVSVKRGGIGAGVGVRLRHLARSGPEIGGACDRSLDALHSRFISVLSARYVDKL